MERIQGVVVDSDMRDIAIKMNRPEDLRIRWERKGEI